MAAGHGSPRKRRRSIWTRTLAIEVGVLLAVPVVFGVVAGFFEINPVEAEMLAPVGSEAHLLLWSTPDAHLTVEIAYQSSIGPPSPSSTATLLDRINSTSDKSSVTLDEHAFSSSAGSFTDSGLSQLETQVRQNWPVPGSMSLFYLYVNGAYASDSSVIGLAFRGSSIAIFEGAIVADTSLYGAVPTTTTVMIHEYGHEIGLVGLVGNAPNEDHAHPPHSTDPTDVMYWQVDSTQIALLGNNPPTQFDAADRSDLATVRSTPIPTEVLPWAVLAASLLLVLALLLLAVRARRREEDAVRLPAAAEGHGPDRAG